jgi:hypothetical protein
MEYLDYSSRKWNTWSRSQIMKRKYSISRETEYLGSFLQEMEYLEQIADYADFADGYFENKAFPN